MKDDDSIGNRKVYEEDKTMRNVDPPILFIRFELRERQLRAFGTGTHDAISAASQTDDDFSHVSLRNDKLFKFRFNGVIFSWIPGECKQNQPIFSISGGIRVTYVGNSILLKNVDEINEVTIDHTYRTYLVCIWSYDETYHMSVLGKSTGTAAWDPAWYGMTVRRQPTWAQTIDSAVHVHRSIHGLVWYQSNAAEASMPEERYLQTIATKRFQ
jgi:hypothetical protein